MTRCRFLVLGSGGTLGSAFMDLLGDMASGLDLPQVDVTDPPALSAALQVVRPSVVLNCSAMTDVDECERRPDAAFRIHRDAILTMVSAPPRLVTFSTDQVFSGMRDTPWLETDAPNPPNVYAESKLAGERIALSRADSIVVRTSWLFDDGKGLVPFLARQTAGGGTVRAVTDQRASVTYAPDLAAATLRALEHGFSGLIHLVNGGDLTPFELALHISGGEGEVKPACWADLGLPARRPAYSVLGTATEYVLPPWMDALERWRRR